MRNRQEFPFIQVGIFQQHSKIEVVYWDKQDFHYCEFELIQGVNISEKIANLLGLSLKEYQTRVRYVSAIAAHQVWHKTVIVPQQLTEDECLQQCQHLIQQAFPALEAKECWFDYQMEFLKQGMRLDIIAVMKSIAEKTILSYLPISITVLNTVPMCIMRACLYLVGEKLPTHSLILYQDLHTCLALIDTGYDFMVLNKNESSLFALYQEVVAFDMDIQQVFAYQHSQIKTLNIQEQHCKDKSWQWLKNDIPLIPLGAALWGNYQGH
ncbi:MAG: hypothetical protein Q4A81_03310 [Pasteurellaceae bacterium]|nr:hypothetical protein [Pasteurellaceae bacterium]